MSKIANLTPKQALAAWAEANGIKPTVFARKTGYTYSYAWSILRGNAEITSDALGKIVLAFGADSVKPVIEAMQTCVEVSA
jgi:hypothetical protein